MTLCLQEVLTTQLNCIYIYRYHFDSNESLVGCRYPGIAAQLQFQLRTSSDQFIMSADPSSKPWLASDPIGLDLCDVISHRKSPFHLEPYVAADEGVYAFVMMYAATYG